jgi:hypothetical protein
VVEWLMMFWHVVLLIDDWETQQSITVEEMSEKGRTVVNVTGTYCTTHWLVKIRLETWEDIKVTSNATILIVDLKIVYVLVENQWLWRK